MALTPIDYYVRLLCPCLSQCMKSYLKLADADYQAGLWPIPIRCGCGIILYYSARRYKNGNESVANLENVEQLEHFVRQQILNDLEKK